MVPNSTTTTFFVESTDDIDNAVWLLRLTYLIHVARIQHRADATEKLAAIDVEQELTAAELSDRLRTIFENHLTEIQE